MRAVLLATVALAVLGGPAAAASCINTYNRAGQVTGKFCADGSGPEAQTEIPQGQVRRPTGKVYGDRGARASNLPRGVVIDCARGGRKGRCRGTFSLR